MRKVSKKMASFQAFGVNRCFFKGLDGVPVYHVPQQWALFRNIFKSVDLLFRHFHCKKKIMFITSTTVMDKATAKNVSLRRDLVLIL